MGDQRSCIEKLSSVKDEVDSMLKITSKPGEQSEDNNNPTSTKAISNRLSPVLSRSCQRGDEELSSVKDGIDSIFKIASKLEEQSEDNNNPTLNKSVSYRLSPVPSSDVTTNEKTSDPNQIAALPETIEKNQKERDEAYQEGSVAKRNMEENQIEALRNAIKKLQQERDEANQEKLATKRKMEEILSQEKDYENKINDINKKWSKRVKIMEEKFRFAALQKEIVMKNTMEKILSSEKKKFRIYKNIWKQKKQFYQSSTYSLQQQLSSDSSSSEDEGGGGGGYNAIF